jgi:hypothetical protein
MTKQLLSWAQNFTHNNKWDRLAKTTKGTLVAASVWQGENEKFSTSVGAGETLITKGGFDSMQTAKQFADDELKEQGYSF